MSKVADTHCNKTQTVQSKKLVNCLNTQIRFLPETHKSDFQAFILSIYDNTTKWNVIGYLIMTLELKFRLKQLYRFKKNKKDYIMFGTNLLQKKTCEQFFVMFKAAENYCPTIVTETTLIENFSIAEDVIEYQGYCCQPFDNSIKIDINWFHLFKQFQRDNLNVKIIYRAIPTLKKITNQFIVEFNKAFIVAKNKCYNESDRCIPGIYLTGKTYSSRMQLLMNIENKYPIVCIIKLNKEKKVYEFDELIDIEDAALHARLYKVLPSKWLDKIEEMKKIRNKMGNNNKNGNKNNIEDDSKERTAYQISNTIETTVQLGNIKYENKVVYYTDSNNINVIKTTTTNKLIHNGLELKTISSNNFNFK